METSDSEGDQCLKKKKKYSRLKETGDGCNFKEGVRRSQ